MKCIFVTFGQEYLGYCTLQADNFIPRDKLQPSGMKWFTLQVWQFIPWDEIQPSGCKTQFFLPIGYEIPQFRKCPYISII